MSWSIDKTSRGKQVLLFNNSDSGYGDIVDVSVPSDSEYEDEYVKMTVSGKDDYLYLELNVFDYSMTEFSEAFRNRDFSATDFVKCWEEHQDRAQKVNGEIQGVTSEDCLHAEERPSVVENGDAGMVNIGAGMVNIGAGMVNIGAGMINSSVDMANSAVGIKNNATDMEIGYTGMENSATGMENSATGMKNSATGMKNSVAGMENSDGGIENNDGGIENSTAGMENSATEIENSSNGLEKRVNGKESGDEGKNGAPKRKRRKTISGRRRAILAWERNLRAGTDRRGVILGASGWPPHFRPWVEEMRQRLVIETGKKEDWDADDVAMLRKYFYLKHRIPVSNTSTISIHIKLASMSPRCYDLTQKIMDLFEAGKLERAQRNGLAAIVHSSYFSFLYNVDVRIMEEKVHMLLERVVSEKKRPHRIINKCSQQVNHQQEIKSKEDEVKDLRRKLEISTKETKNKEEEINKLKCLQEASTKRINKLEDDMEYLYKSLRKTNEESRNKEDELQKLKCQLEESTKQLNKYEDNFTSLLHTTMKLDKVKKVCENLRKENDSLRQEKIASRFLSDTCEKESDSEEQLDLEAEIDRIRRSHQKNSKFLRQWDKEMMKQGQVKDKSKQKKNEESRKNDSKNPDKSPDDTLAIQPNDWVAVNYDTGIFYVGKVLEVNKEKKTGKATFLKKIIGNKYKESAKKETSVESFALEQVFSTAVNIEYNRGGSYVLHNKDELEKLYKHVKK